MKTLITIHVLGRGRITVEQWARNPRPHGSMDLRFPAQKIEIERRSGPNFPRVNNDIFLRDKKAKEADLVSLEAI